jgi:hypothetical protein
MTTTVIAEHTIPAVDLYGHALALTIRIVKRELEGWDSERQCPDPHTTWTVEGSGATNFNQGCDDETDARKIANAMWDWYKGMSRLHPTFKANRTWLDANRPGGMSARPW